MTHPLRRLSSLLASSFLFLLVTLPSSALAVSVVIDPGHGGPYRAGSVYGSTEKALNLAVARELKAVLTARGHTVGMTRTTDAALQLHDIPTWNWSESAGWRFCADGRAGGDPPKDDLQARCDVANASGADLFVSIHQNAGGGTARGTETYAAEQDILGQRMAEHVQREVVQAVGTRDRGAKETDFYVVRWTNMPAVLVECGFYDNAYDSALLRSPSFRHKLAVGMANGIDDFLGTDPFKPVYGRLAGSNRFGTATSVSKAGWPSGAQTVLLASGRNWPDALAAGPLSMKLDAPLLLTETGTVPPATAAELARLAPTRIVVLGGEGAVDATCAAEAALAAGLDVSAVERIAGADRYETAALIAKRVGVPATGHVFVASGRSFADGLAASGAAGKMRAPLVLTEPSCVPTVTREFLASNTVTSTIVVGGTGVIPSGVADALPKVTRLAGADRYATAVAVANGFWSRGAVQPLWAAGHDWPDALVGGSFSAKTGRPMLLLGHRRMSAKTREWIQRSQDAGRLPEDRTAAFTILGGIGPVPVLMEWELRKARD